LQHQAFFCLDQPLSHVKRPSSQRNFFPQPTPRSWQHHRRLSPVQGAVSPGLQVQPLAGAGAAVGCAAAHPCCLCSQHQASLLALQPLTCSLKQSHSSDGAAGASWAASEGSVQPTPLCTQQ